ncbi:translation initiation factor IF-3 [Microgenomates group bacterium]|nr:translation initiation factor IF-3 [Microgenomates group bacterium]
MIKRFTNHSKRRSFTARRDKIFITANQSIAAEQLRVMDEFGKPLGVMSKGEALQKARASEKDLVLITDKATPPVAKIIDLSKHKYQLSQKLSQERKKSNSQDTKEVRLTPFIDENDLQAKLNRVSEFLKRGDKVRLTMEFRGRAITHQDLGLSLMERAIAQVADISTIEIEPKMIGKKLVAGLMPKNKKK